MEISKEYFEKYVAVNTPKDNLLTIFEMTFDQMDRWCRKTYGKGFTDVYTIMVMQAIARYKDAMMFLAESGNATAMATMNKILLDVNESSELNVTIHGFVPKEENDDDK